ncbi:hypothetical protein NF701_01205 [Sphingomonadaceae bacterium OTU29THOMA1]|uniref:hypothetical protein n=1 Tax=Sphingomonas sp. Leaf37 TaxID=2876552 RepID=UPI001E47BDCE|nr:hypothetical protein [Sphingomonas sp. Leaf37]USU05448.1 hypothetical protein NF699_01735 [Sphingomonadaceae bacterium OTU29LAMAA1]USU12524.1 hypothetical protein NF701_01205 [Sphingomonadaceae bacterium OTU29THOMA1]
MRGRDMESRIALAMLPLGAIMMLAAALGFVAVAALAIDLAWRQPPHAGLWLLWCLAALTVAAVNLRQGIETMATFDWHVAVVPLLLSTVITTICPAFWL